MKRNRYKELTFHSLKNYSADISKETLVRILFPNYEKLGNPNIAHSTFITRLDCVINTIAPFKTVRIKNNASEWFDGQIPKEIHTRDKLYKKIKSINFMLMKRSIKRFRKAIQNLTRKKKKACFKEKLKENTANPKNLWKSSKQLGLS